MLERMWRKGNSPALWWECKLVQPLWETVWRFLGEQKKQNYRMTQQSHSSEYFWTKL